MVLCAALAGFGLILYVSSTNTLIQLTVEDRYRGRVMSLYTLFFVGTSPFGALLSAPPAPAARSPPPLRCFVGGCCGVGWLAGARRGAPGGRASNAPNGGRTD